MQRLVITKRARQLRRAMTEPEVMLWSRLRGRSPDRPRFRRQHPFGSIILDFYCAEARLAVEVDGSTHWDEEARAKDAARDADLTWRGFTVLRFTNTDVSEKLDGVVIEILAALGAVTKFE